MATLCLYYLHIATSICLIRRILYGRPQLILESWLGNFGFTSVEPDTIFRREAMSENAYASQSILCFSKIAFSVKNGSLMGKCQQISAK